MFLFPIDTPAAPVVVSSTNVKSLPPKSAVSAVPPALTAVPVPATPKLAAPSAQKPLAQSKLAQPQSKLDQLRAQVQRIQSRGRGGEPDTEPRFSAGGAVLDAMLPHRGLRQGTIVQWVGDASGNGAASLATIAAAGIAHSEVSGSKPLVIFDFGLGKNFYPPAAISLGVPADRMVIVSKKKHHTNADMIWAIDQALRCDAVAAVWAELGPWLNDRDARRFQLAAEAGGTVGLFVRPAEVRRRPSFSDVSWHVSSIQDPTCGSANRRLRVEIDRCRGGAEGANAIVEISPRFEQDKDRVVAVAAASLNSLPLRSKHESTLVSDLARRLADPAIANRGSTDRDRRDATKRAS